MPTQLVSSDVILVPVDPPMELELDAEFLCVGPSLTREEVERRFGISLSSFCEITTRLGPAFYGETGSHAQQSPMSFDNSQDHVPDQDCKICE